MNSKENSEKFVSTFQIPPSSNAIKVSVVIEFIHSSAACGTSGRSITARSLDVVANGDEDQSSSELHSLGDGTSGSHPGGAVFEAGSWIKSIQTIPASISVSSGGKTKSKSESDAHAGNSPGKFFSIMSMRFNLMNCRCCRQLVVYLDYVLSASPILVGRAKAGTLAHESKAVKDFLGFPTRPPQVWHCRAITHPFIAI